MGVRGGKGSGAGVPPGRRIGGTSHATGGLRVVTRGIARSVGVRDNADCGVGAKGGEEGVGVPGEGIVPRRSFEPGFGESERIRAQCCDLAHSELTTTGDGKKVAALEEALKGAAPLA